MTACVTRGRWWRSLSCALLPIVLSSPARAQQAPAGPPGVQVGPVSVKTRLDVREIGVDDNVFNDPENPQSDFTATITPRVDLLLRLGPSRLTFGSFVDLVYYQDFEEERTTNQGFEGRLEFDQGLLRPFVFGSLVDTRERANTEIDARAPRRQRGYGGGATVAVTSRTNLTFTARRSEQDYDEGAAYRGVELSETLNFVADALEAELRLQLTPLTSWHVRGAVLRDRFSGDPRRDSEGLRLLSGLRFEPTALLAGTVDLGYRRLTPGDPLLPEFQGFVTILGLTYALESTRIDVRVERDVRYSYERERPYYLVLAGRLTATQQIAGPVDVQGVLGRESLSYRDFGAGSEEARLDTYKLYGGGMGYRLGETSRMGVNIEWSERRSDTQPDRYYDRRRIYGSLTYGF